MMDNIDDVEGHYFHDDGTEFNPDLIPKPALCVSCKKDGIGGEEDILCNLNRADQQNDLEFNCYAYEPKGVSEEDNL
jgi:hypothetical protein